MFVSFGKVFTMTRGSKVKHECLSYGKIIYYYCCCCYIIIIIIIIIFIIIIIIIIIIMNTKPQNPFYFRRHDCLV